VREPLVRHTPLELRQRRFRTVLRGFDRDEVVTYLAEVADDYEQVVRQLETIQHDVQRLDRSLDEHRQREETLRNTLMTAQKLADDIREAAQQEARIIAREAESRADLLLEKAQARLDDLERQITDLRLKRRGVEATIEASIASLHQTLEFIRGQERTDREDRILLHRPRQSETPARTGEAGADLQARRAERDD
jgi:cell division initiation protein